MDRTPAVQDQASADFVARSNAIFVTVEDMFLASDEIHKLPSDDRNWEGRMNCLTQIFRGRRDKAYVVNARLEAMAQLVRAGKLPYGVLPTGVDGLDLIAEPVFTAAAKVPIRFVDKKSYFEPEPFTVFVLENAKACGRA